MMAAATEGKSRKATAGVTHATSALISEEILQKADTLKSLDDSIPRL